MTRFWWVRHGPTHARGLCGWTDLPADLSDTALLARLRACLPAAPVISSDLVRAAETADAISGARPRLPHDADLREMNFGRWEGLAFDAPEAAGLRTFYDGPGTRRAPGGESWNDLADRTGAAVERLLRTGAPDIVCVAHMGPILTQLQRALGLGAYDTLGHRIDPLSVTRIVHETGAWRAEAINHLP